jgi:hypothetical protein
MAAGWYEDETGPKLPVWQTVGEAYRAFFANIGSLIRVCWPWLLVIGGLTIWSFSLGTAWQTAAMAAMKAKQPLPPQPVELVVISHFCNLIYFSGTAILAVGWHRFLLLGEPPRLSGNLFTAPVWRYVGVGMLMTLTAMLPLFIVMVPAALFTSGMVSTTRSNESTAAIMLFMIPAGCAATALLTRLSLALPARALGHNGVTFRSVWRTTTGNTWRLILGFCLSTVPLLLIPWVVLLLLSDPTAMFRGMAIPVGLIVAVQLLTSMIGIAFVSFAYRHFFAPRDAQLPA